MTWVLVFWLAVETNYSEYERYSDQTSCEQSRLRWQQRLDQVQSRLRAECRQINK